MVRKCGVFQCKCCNYLLLLNSYLFKQVGYKFSLKMSCDSLNVIYVVICSGCGEEYIEESDIRKQKLRFRVRIYRQHIRQPEYQQLKVKGHLRQYGNVKFRILTFLQLRTNDKDLRRSFEKGFKDRFQTKLNRLLHEMRKRAQQTSFS